MNVLSLLNKVQELNSSTNAINLQKQNLWEITGQIDQGEKVLEIMKQNKISIEKSIWDLENEKALIEPQVQMLYEITKAEYTEFAKFDETDPEYMQKINFEAEMVQRLNLVEKMLWKELTPNPQRTITVKTQVSPVEEKVCETADNCSLN